MNVGEPDLRCGSQLQEGSNADAVRAELIAFAIDGETPVFRRLERTPRSAKYHSTIPLYFDGGLRHGDSVRVGSEPFRTVHGEPRLAPFAHVPIRKTLCSI